MKLYHLTSIYHLPLVLASGYIKLTESNISLVPGKDHAGPDVVWLTSSRRPGQGWARMADQFAYVDKCRIQIEVALPDDEVHAWYDWALAHGSNEHFMRALAASGDERTGMRQGHLYDDLGNAALARARADWFVIERQVPWTEWVGITDLLAGTVIWSNTEEQVASGTLALSKLWQPKVKGGPERTLMVNSAGHFVPTTITSRENPGYAVQIGGAGEPDLILDGRDIPVNEQVYERLQEYRRPGDSDDTMVRRALDDAGNPAP